MESWKKTFAVIWSGQLASILSSEVVAYSIIFWMSLETGSAEVLALAAIAGMLPQSLLGPLVGVYVDRWDRKRTMILADSFIALCTLRSSRASPESTRSSPRCRASRVRPSERC